jgi:flagellar assembly protein FliH
MGILKHSNHNQGQTVIIETVNSQQSQPSLLKKHPIGPQNRIIKRHAIIHSGKQIILEPQVSIYQVTPENQTDNSIENNQDSQEEKKETTDSEQNQEQNQQEPDEKLPEINMEELQQRAEQKIAIYKKDQFAAIDKEKKDILDQAYEKGLQEGKQNTEDSLKEKLAEMSQTIKSLSDERVRVIQGAKKEIIELATHISEKIIQNQINSNDQIVLNVIDEAMSKITDKDRVIIKVNSDDVAIVRENRNKIMELMKDIKNLEVQEDTSLSKGGCIIETRLGYIDSSVNTKITSIKEALFDIYDEEAEALDASLDIAKNQATPTQIATAVQPVTQTFETETNTQSAAPAIADTPITEAEEIDSELDFEDDLDLDTLSPTSDSDPTQAPIAAITETATTDQLDEDFDDDFDLDFDDDDDADDSDIDFDDDY